MCRACGFDFENVYVGISNRKYIEAHHVVPMVLTRRLQPTRSPGQSPEKPLWNSQQQQGIVSPGPVPKQGVIVTSCKLRFQRFSYRFAEQVLNSKLTLKQEIEEILWEQIPDVNALSRPEFNKLLDQRFTAKG